METIWSGGKPVKQQDGEDAIILNKCSSGSGGGMIEGLVDENDEFLVDENDEILT